MRNNLAIAAQTIKDRVSALDVGEVLGLNIDKHGRCSCPFHNGRDRNMKLFSGDRGYTCFVCHNSGDIIKFVQQYYGMNFKDAVIWINDTFHLGLELGKTDPEEQRRAEIAIQRRKRAREFLKWKQDMRFELNLTAGQILMRLEQMRDEHMPTKPDEPWDREFCEAVRLIPEAKLFAEECYMKCTEEKKG